jgi:uncharacterized protein YecE (DUF72 family)
LRKGVFGAVPAGKDAVLTRLGTAAWGLPAAVRDRFPAGDSLLRRYAGVFNGVEINSSFYRPHRRETYARWGASTPDDFRFAVKAPRTVTHERGLVNVAEPVERFLDEIGGLGGKLGPVLIQGPPSLRFAPDVADAFFTLWRERFDGRTVCEPRHKSWFTPEAERVLIRHRIVRVAADPALMHAAGAPGGWDGFAYFRLHGSPEIYASSYGADMLARLAADLPEAAWVIFDNTKFGAATENALTLQGLLTRRRALLSP